MPSRFLFNARIAAVAEMENLLPQTRSLATQRSLVKLEKTVSISTQRSLVTNLYDPCVTSDPRVTSNPCDHMETRLNQR